METENEVTRALDDLGDALRRQPSVQREVMQRVTAHAATGGAPSAGRWSGRRMVTRLAALAACLVVALLIWSPWGGGGIGAQQAFAAAIAQVEAAGTFACRQIVTSVDEDGQEQVRESAFMFKEPDLERIEYGEGMPMPGEFMVTDYGKQVRLTAFPEEKTASLQDISSMYAVDEGSGRLKPSELSTDVRDHVLRLTAQAVVDLGMTKLDGREVWVLQSAGEAEPVKTVYINPADGKPVRIDIARPSQRQTFTYADIQLDVPIDEQLFSLEPPPGYAMDGGHERPVKPVDDMNGKMLTKARALAMECIIYWSEHDSRWPQTLDDLRAGGMDAQKLQNLLAAPDSKDGKPAFLYRKPRGDEKEAVIILYEASEVRRERGVVCGFSDAHAELVSHEQFQKLMKQ